MQRADVSFRDKEARVTFEPTRVTVEQLIEAVNASGFRASLKRDGRGDPARLSPDPSRETAIGPGPRELVRARRHRGRCA